MCSPSAAAPGPESSNTGVARALEDLEREICELAADIAAATCRWLSLIAEFDARGGWAEWGVHSCAHWLSWRLGIGLRAGQEHVRVARALGALPRLSAAFAAGRLSYSKVRALTRVAQPETEEDLLMIAEHATGAQIERLVRGYAGVIRATRAQALENAERQCLNCDWDEDGMLRISGRLTAEDGAALLGVLEANAPDDRLLPASARRARALGRLVDAERVRGAELVVHVDVGSLPAESIVERCEVEGGPSIAPELARRLGCDGAVVTILERDGEPLSVGRRTRAIPPALRRALRSRDPVCRFPGCTHTHFLHAHHIRHWAQGGETAMSNLIHLCSEHHRLVHEGGYAVDRDRRGHPRFWAPGGRPIVDGSELGRPSGRSLHTLNGERGVVTDAESPRPLSAGDGLDYGIAVEGLARKWLPPPDWGQV
ncbi:HNH endonuclease signature motif containing protein [Conexibacter sp. DBS9H8]|uniref:HNH endonuclease signature motif containing protein n=1 Tax=Conexibacter sp. DBS9H8 TaxID=2937801 RepID=UPI002010A790|nr:HNH endonuclease signature motif containing protein [Conexibacter sp. DBS9H8]